MTPLFLLAGTPLARRLIDLIGSVLGAGYRVTGASPARPVPVPVPVAKRPRD